MKSSDDDIVWSDESLTIRDVVYQTMPTVVRVAEGFYSGNEAESFSRGDLLKLDFVKSIQKVYATIISSWSHAIIEDGTGYMQPDKEIVIPLGYKGKVVITRPPAECKVYFTVAELMCDFPRFVRVDKPFFVQSNDNTAIQIEAGKKLELDRYLPTQGLIAKYENEIVVINNSIKSRFVPLPDDTEYTLIEVVDRLPLPQFVTFVEDEFKKLVTTDLLEAVDNVQSFTGCVKLNRVFREEVVVGHHKPQIPECLKKEYGKYVRRSVVLLPLSRDAVNEIEVNVPVYLEPDDYAFLVASNFSQKSPNEDIIDGSLYLEFAKNPRSVYVIDEEDVPLYEEPEVPPPIPPRPKNHSEDFDLFWRFCRPKMKSSDDDIVWSDESLTIRDVVYQTMPTVVRVAEGFYSGNEAESFSRGDLLKLDFVKSIQKVYATIISSWSHAIIEDGTGYMQPDKEIVIPLGYKGKVVITRPPAECKVYFTVAELMCDFPRFVRVDKPFFVQSNDNTAIQIEAGKKLELDRYLPTQGLIAKYENEIVVINNSIKSRFVPLPDDTEYTLIEVVDRLPLPQFVTFVEDEFKKLVTTDLLEAVDNVQSFTGCVKLNRVFREEVVVGHHKPQIPECLKKEYGKYVRRSVVLLPLSRDAVNEIEVNVPVYLEPDDYAFLVASNFSQKSPNEDIIDGSLYLEFAKNPRSVYVIDEEDVPLYEEPEVPPPIPPRPKNHSEGGSNPKVTTPISASRPEEQLKPTKYGSKPKITRPESEELDYEPVSERPTPPKIVPRSIQQNRETHKHNPSQKVGIETPQTGEELDGPLLIYEVSDDESDSYIGLTQSKPKRHIPKTFYKKLKSVQSELKARITSKGHSLKPHQLNITALVSQPIPSLSPISPTSIGNSKPILLPTRLVGKSKHSPSPTSPTSIGRSIPIKPHPLPTLPPPLPKPKHNKTQTKSKAKGQETSQSSYINMKVKAPRPKHTVAEKVQCDEKQTVKLDEKDKIDDDDDDDDEVTYDYPDISKMTNLPPPQSQGRPIVRVQPSTRVVPTTSTSVSQMSVKDLVLCLNQCALPELAKLCDKHTIDGKFLSDLKDHDLRDKPYSLNIIEVAKVQKMKEGWRPKID